MVLINYQGIKYLIDHMPYLVMEHWLRYVKIGIS